MHPPFRWQRRYAEGFAEQVAELEAASDVLVAVENMFPFRADRFFGAGQTSIERMRKRGGGPGLGISAFAPSYDPLDGNHAHYTLDLSHTATAGTDALDMAQPDGRRGWCICTCATAPVRPPTSTWCPAAAPSRPPRCARCWPASDFAGHVVLEVTTSGARSEAEREALLAESLQFARTHLMR